MLDIGKTAFYYRCMSKNFVNFRCPGGLYVLLKREAERLDRTVTWVIIDALEKYFKVDNED